MAISSFSNPIPELIQGLLQGNELGMRVRNQQMQEQAFKTKQALDQQNMSIQDVMNRQMLGQNARPVDQAGTVTQDVNLPAGPSLPSPIEGMPASPGAPAYSGQVARKADASRTVKYGGQSYELKTPEEQAADVAARTAATKRATSTMVRVTPELQQQFGLSSPEFPIPDEHMAQYLGSIRANQTKQNVAGANNATKLATTADTNQTRQTIAANSDATKTGIATDANATKTGIASGKNTLDAALAKARNQTAENVANIKHSPMPATGGQAGVQNRFDAKQAAQQQKALAAVQAKEDKAHAARIQLGQENTQLGQQMQAGTLNPIATAAARQKILANDAKLSALGSEIQSHQAAKAKVMGAQTPPKAFADSVPEGKFAASPDGHTWMKKDGVLYFQQ